MGEAAALVSAFVWSGTSVVLTTLGAKVQPAVLSALRLTAGSFVLVLIVLVAGKAGEYGEASFATIAWLIASGLLGYAIGDTLYIRALGVLGMQRTFPVTTALFIVFSVVGGILLLDEPFSWGLAGGAVLIGAGIYLVVIGRRAQVPLPVDDSGTGEVLPPRTKPWHEHLFAGGYWLLIAVGLTWACATLLLASQRGDLGAIAAGTLRTPAGAIGLLGFTAAMQREAFIVPFKDRRVLLSITAAGIIGTAFGSLLYVYSVLEAGAARAVILNSTSPLMALPLTVIFLGERLTRRITAGTVLCVAGIILVVA